MSLGSKGGKAPKAPNPDAVASAEARYNRPTTVNSDGSHVLQGYIDQNGQFQAGPVMPNTQAASKAVESPYQQMIRAMTEPAAANVTRHIIDQNTGNMPAPARVQDRTDVAKALFDRNMSMMQPAIDKSQRRLLTNLQARGLPIGGAAFNDAYGEQTRQTQDTISRLAQDATVAAGQEQSRQFGLDSAARSTAVQELITALGGGFSPPAAMQPGGTSPVDYAGAVGNQYQAKLAKYQADQGQAASTKGLMGTLGAAAIMSSREFKDVVGGVDPVAVWQALQAMPVQAWAYKPEIAPADRATHIGPMAEDFQRATGLGDGKSISVTDMLGLLLSALQSAMVRIEGLEAWARVSQHIADETADDFEMVVH